MPEQPKVIEVEEPGKCSEVALKTGWCARTQTYCHSKDKYCFISRLDMTRRCMSHMDVRVKAKE